MSDFITFFNNKGDVCWDKQVKVDNQYFFDDKTLVVINDNYIINNRINCITKTCACKINSFTWVSNKNQSIWYEIPKSASRSIVEALSLQEPNLNILFKKLVKHENFNFTLFYNSENKLIIKQILRRIRLFNLTGYKIFKNGIFELSLEEEVNDFYSFAILRNPFDRIISNYKMFRTHPNRIEKLKETFEIDSIEDLTFDTFLDSSLRHSNHHWEPQVNFLPKDIKQVTKLTTLEKLNYDWNEISKNIGSNNKLLKLNSTKYSSSNYNKYLTKESFLKIKNKYHQDIELYNLIANEDISNHVGRQLS